MRVTGSIRIGVCAGAALCVCWTGPQAQPEPVPVPGVIIAHRAASTENYIGSPSLAVLPDGSYVASHDFFGPGPDGNTVVVYRSEDRGATWRESARFPDFWANLFVHRGALYCMGVSREHGHVVIRRSDDGGRSWTEPVDGRSGLLLADAKYHTAPVPMVVHRGRLWRAFEDAEGPGGWGSHFRAFVMSAPLESDLLRADSWSRTNSLPGDPEWLMGQFGGWLEGNVVVAPDGRLLNLLRVEVPSQPERAAVAEVDTDAGVLRFRPREGFLELPGAAKKFTIRHDPVSDLYWSIVNYVPPEFADNHPGETRNTVALVSSPDLLDWTVRRILIQHPEVKFHGYQYWDWLILGADILAVSRTAHDDGLGGARNFHDANFLTFHRIEGFRQP